MSAIGIDYTPAIQQSAGIGRLVRELVRHLAKHEHATDFRLFVANHKASISLPTVGHNFQWRTTSISDRWLARIWHRAGIPLPIEVFTGPVGVFHATDFVLPPTLPSTYRILTVHDLSFIQVPEAAPKRLQEYLSQVVPYSVRRANCILADSMATKQDIINYYQVNPDKIKVLYSAVAEHFKPVRDPQLLQRTLSKYHLNRPYIFALGTVQPRKNYSRLVRALSILHHRGYEIDLVIAGGPGWLQDEMYATIRETSMEAFIRVLGFVSDDDAPVLYSAAQATVIPSLYEGFGFPVLEAMACGSPVVTSNISSLPEVGGDAALLVDPYQTDDIADAIQQILNDTDLRAQMITSGFAHNSKFNWDNSARQLLAIYQQALAGL